MATIKLMRTHVGAGMAEASPDHNGYTEESPSGGLYSHDGEVSQFFLAVCTVPIGFYTSSTGS